MARSAWLPAASCFSAGAITVPRLTDIAFCAWVAQAEPGDWLEYHRGVLAVDRLKTISDLSERERSRVDQLAARALRAAEEGLVHLVQTRIAPDRFSYLAVARPRTERAAKTIRTLITGEASA